MFDPYTVLDQHLKVPSSQVRIDVSNHAAGVPFLITRDAMRNEPKLDCILNDVAARVLQATGATSVVVGLGREDAMICCATAGLPFPNLEVRINTELGLTAVAIRRQMSQWCNDTESDSRVDVEVCRQLGVRSIIVVPVCVRDTVVGVIAIFSANSDAFSLGDLNSVKELAQLASEAIETTTVGNIAQPTTAPAATRPEHLGRGHLGDVNSVQTCGAELRKYAMRIRRAIVLALTRRRP
jgi:transcriptional regulator with GAF, ATPase, and Fis domain